jgi:hypothetical protein
MIFSEAAKSVTFNITFVLYDGTCVHIAAALTPGSTFAQQVGEIYKDVITRIEGRSAMHIVVNEKGTFFNEIFVPRRGTLVAARVMEVK